MIKIIPTPGTDRIVITTDGKVVDLSILSQYLDEWVLPQLSELAHSIKDNDDDNISAIYYKSDKITFIKLVGQHEVPTYVGEFPVVQLRTCLMEVALAITGKWDILFPEKEG